MHTGEAKTLAIIGMHGLSEPAFLREFVLAVGNCTNVYQAALPHPIGHGVVYGPHLVNGQNL